MLFPTFKLKAPNKKANSSEISKMTEWKNETHSQTTSNETRLQAALKAVPWHHYALIILPFKGLKLILNLL